MSAASDRLGPTVRTQLALNWGHLVPQTPYSNPLIGHGRDGYGPEMGPALRTCPRGGRQWGTRIKTGMRTANDMKLSTWPCNSVSLGAVSASARSTTGQSHQATSTSCCATRQVEKGDQAESGFLRHLATSKGEHYREQSPCLISCSVSSQGFGYSRLVSRGHGI